MTLDAPMPYYGGKKLIAARVWEAFGDVPNYVEPFFGSGAVLLCRPEHHTGHIETVNDKDGLLANFWRAVQKDPEQTAFHADWPVNECDLHARHAWLIGQMDGLQTKLEGDPDYYDVKAAGWWVWGMSCWIGSGFCSGNGPWHVVDGELVKGENDGTGICRQLPNIGNQGKGIFHKLPHLSGARGVKRQRPHLSGARGVNRQIPLQAWFQSLSDRLRYVRVCCGDWTRVLGPSPTFQLGMTAVFLDPPYAPEGRDATLYRVEADISGAVREWAIEAGKNPLMRVALCGYEGEHEMPPDWLTYHWKAAGGYGLQGEGRGRENRGREVLWFSPACLQPTQQTKLL